MKRLTLAENLTIDQRRLEELWREIDALRFLRHPRLVRFIGACIAPPHICVLTEFMPGGSLYGLLHEKKAKLSWPQQVTLGMQIGEAIAFLHSHVPPVVHRDVKSMNVLLDLQLNAKLCDFGLTSPMECNKTHISRQAGGESGSPRYMAPEFYLETSKITEKVDVWALGCVLIECFGGPLPYHDCQSINAICARICVNKVGPVIPSVFPQALGALIQRCLVFDVAQRCSAQEVHARLGQLQQGPGPMMLSR